jgi:phosphoglycerate dehydrogenase-like enzyme
MGTPHVSGNAAGGVSVAQSNAARNVRRFLNGKPTKGKVDRSDYEREPSVSPPTK